MKVLIISIILVSFFSFLALIFKKNNDFFIITAILVTIIGLIIIPTIHLHHIKYEKIKNYQLIKAENSIIIDLENSSHNSSYNNNLFKFSSYKAVNEINDSTKFFMAKEKTFYKLTLKSYIVWSKPPYKYYNKK